MDISHIQRSSSQRHSTMSNHQACFLALANGLSAVLNRHGMTRQAGFRLNDSIVAPIGWLKSVFTIGLLSAKTHLKFGLSRFRPCFRLLHKLSSFFHFPISWYAAIFQSFIFLIFLFYMFLVGFKIGSVIAAPLEPGLCHAFGNEL